MTKVKERLAVDDDHPLSEDLARIARLSNFFRGELGLPRGGWASLRRLASDEGTLDDVVKRNALAYRATRRLASNFVAGGVAWAAAAAALATMVTRRRAIAPDADRTFIHVDALGETRGVVYDDPEFCVLSNDPGSEHHRAEVVDDVPGMHTWLRPRLVSSMTPLIETLSELSGLARKSLWGQVTASWGSIIVWAAELGGDASHGAVEAEAFLTSPERPFSNVPTFYRVGHRDGEITVMRRGVCCLAYKLADHHYCGSCPLISDDERDQRFRDAADSELPNGC